PTTAGIGSTRWVKFTLDSGSAWDAGLAAGTLHRALVDLELQWTQSVSGSRSASVTVQIYSDAGGTTLVSTGTVSALVSLTLIGGGA
ncbi:MAG: hypothetical protein ACR2JA_09065, partial [Hydrogenophaga sp.]|uniref:hypothetical protein n=1 Tax=Hydrogenophaga sp. TaxID=1904254 RepID=UPI003D9B5B91